MAQTTPPPLPPEHDPRNQQAPRPTWDQIVVAILTILIAGVTALQSVRGLLETDPLTAGIVVALALLTAAVTAVGYLSGRARVQSDVARGAADIAVAEASREQPRPPVSFKNGGAS